MSLKAIDDVALRTLILQAQAGNAEAFEALVSLCYDDIYRFALKFTGLPDRAADVAQDSCIKLAGSIKHFRFEARFSSWLYRMVSSVCIDATRKHARYDSSEIGHDYDAQLTHSEHLSSADQLSESVYLSQLIALIAGFGKGLLEAVLLVHLGGATHSEAAHLLGIKESTVSWRLHEVRKQLKEYDFDHRVQPAQKMHGKRIKKAPRGAL